VVAQQQYPFVISFAQKKECRGTGELSKVRPLSLYLDREGQVLPSDPLSFHPPNLTQ
jgi:hypothetical protein